MTIERYRAFNTYFRERYGCRVHRVAVDGGFTCPNIDGIKGRGGCFFCDASGSLANYAQSTLPIAEQVRQGAENMARRFLAEKFIVYFQSFTATHGDPARLRPMLEEALGADPRVVGLALGARPDTLPDPMLDMLAEFHERTYLWLDVGLETINDATQKKINRLCTTAEFIETMRRVKARGLQVVSHVIFGLPGDSEADMLGGIDLISDLGLDGIKIHNLYIDSESTYGVLWRKGRIPMISRETYIDLVCRAIGRLHPDILIHRLSGEAPRKRHLAPDWAQDKPQLLKDIQRELERRDVWQGFERD